MPDIVRHFVKCLTSRIACNIYAYIDVSSSVVFIASYSSIFNSFRVYCSRNTASRYAYQSGRGGGMGGGAWQYLEYASLTMQIIILGD